MTSAGGLFLHDFSYAGYHRSEVPLPSSFPGTQISAMTSASAHPNTALTAARPSVRTIAAVVAAGGGVVYVPDGEYIISAPITIQNSNVLIRGQSRANTKLFFEDPQQPGGLHLQGRRSFGGRGLPSWPTASRSKDGVANAELRRATTCSSTR